MPCLKLGNLSLGLGVGASPKIRVISACGVGVGVGVCPTEAKYANCSGVQPGKLVVLCACGNVCDLAILGILLFIGAV